MNRVNVNYLEKQSVSDIFTLTNVSTGQSVSLIPSDSNGNFSWTGITKAPIIRNAMQTSSTSSEWSDLEYPWQAVQQEDWTGGRANLRFTTDKSKFYDSRRAQTAYNSCIYCAPLDHYSDGFKTAYTNCPQSLTWVKLKGSNRYIVRKISGISSGWLCGNVYIHLRKRGTPQSGLQVRLLSSMSENPTVYASHVYTTAEVTDTTAEFFKFSFSAVALPSTVYLEVSTDASTDKNYWEVGFTAKNEHVTYHSANRTSYDIFTHDLLYRLDTVQSDEHCKFFAYEQLMFMVRQVPNGTPTLWINGDIGKVSSAASKSLTDSSKSWTTNEYAGARIGLVYRNGSQGKTSVWRKIVSNTSTQITVDENWDITPAADCEYIIVDTPIWKQITGHGLTSNVTDIHVIRGVVYFAQGDYVDARKMRWNAGSFEWQTLTGIKASYLCSVRDTNGMMLYRGRNDGINHKRTVERSRLLDWNTSETSWATISTAVTTKEPVSKTVSQTITTQEVQPTPEEESTHQVTAETTNSDSPETPSVTVTASKTTKLGNKVISSVGTTTTQSATKSTSGKNTTITTTLDTTKTTEEKEIANPSSTSVTTATATTIDGVTVNDSESVSKSTSVNVSISGNNKTTTTTDTITTSTTKNPTPPLRTSVATDSKDFSYADYDAKQYVITIGSFESENYTGECVVTLQESEDNLAFQDVETVTAIGPGTWRIFAKCQYRYRRFMVTAVGQNTVVNNIAITTSSIPHFEDPIILIDNYGKITRLYEYGSEQEKSLWIFQEGMVSNINKTEGTTDTYNLDRINLDELQVTSEEWNGLAVSTSDVYLLWSWLNGMQRHYNTQVEGKGPDHDEGMPEDMRGRITQILSYPGSSFASIDAGPDGYSSIMLFNSNGWHNIYRAPNKGERIHDIAFQPIYGDRPDRLWAQVGDNVIWLSMPSKILYALQDPNAEYTHESVVVSSWITGGMAEVDKLWQSISIMADNLDGKICQIEADYQLDDEPGWHPIPTNPFDTSPQQEENFADEYESVNGKKMRYRLRLQTTDIHKTPKVNVVLIKVVGRVDIKYSYSFHFRNMKYKADLTGEYEEVEPYDLDFILSEWANKLYTLRMNSAYKIFDNKRVFLDGLQTSVVYEKGEGYLSQITLTEI